MPLRLTALLALALPLSLGCGPSGPRTYPVSGTVTFDGAPIKQGDILFVPADKSLATEGGKIVDGKFALVSKEGVCQVKISALDIGPDTEWISGSPIAANFIPRWYNEETTLTAQVAPRGDNRFDFALSSQSPK